MASSYTQSPTAAIQLSVDPKINVCVFFALFLNRDGGKEGHGIHKVFLAIWKMKEAGLLLLQRAGSEGVDSNDKGGDFTPTTGRTSG